jgi:hypothetical protein
VRRESFKSYIFVLFLQTFVQNMRFEVLTAVKLSLLVFCVATPCGIAGRYQRFVQKSSGINTFFSSLIFRILGRFMSECGWRYKVTSLHCWRLWPVCWANCLSPGLAVATEGLRQRALPDGAKHCRRTEFSGEAVQSEVPVYCVHW